MAPYEGERPPPYPPVFQNVEVEPESLDEFAELINGDIGVLRDAWNYAKGQLDGGPDPNFPGKYPQTFHYGAGYPQLAYDGDDGIQEGNAFYSAYFRTIGAELSLMDEMLLGLTNLREAARLIHNGYVGTDASNAAGVEGTFATYERSSVLVALGEATDDIDGGTGQ